MRGGLGAISFWLRGFLMADRIIELFEANKTTELCDVADEISFEEVD
jgi:hypothetical protein